MRFANPCPCCHPPDLSRRRFLQAAAVVAASSLASSCRTLETEWAEPGVARIPGVPVIDIHQHCAYGRGPGKRPDEDLPRHQKNMGIRATVLLPAATTGALDNWTDAGNDQVAAFVRQHPKYFVGFANENVFRPEAPKTIEKALKAGAIGVGELKDKMECASPEMERVAEVAREYAVPMLLHFQDDRFNNGYANFHRILEKFPTVTFIAHAQSVWAHVDARYQPSMGYLPRTPAEPGGLTDRWLADYPNFYGDLAAIEGNNFLTRNQDFVVPFLTRHQNKLLYGSDCPDRNGVGPTCVGGIKLGLLNQLCATTEVRDKILFRNARRILRLPLATLS